MEDKYHCCIENFKLKCSYDTKLTLEDDDTLRIVFKDIGVTPGNKRYSVENSLYKYKDEEDTMLINSKIYDNPKDIKDFIEYMNSSILLTKETQCFIKRKRGEVFNILKKIIIEYGLYLSDDKDRSINYNNSISRITYKNIFGFTRTISGLVKVDVDDKGKYFINVKEGHKYDKHLKVSSILNIESCFLEVKQIGRSVDDINTIKLEKGDVVNLSGRLFKCTRSGELNFDKRFIYKDCSTAKVIPVSYDKKFEGSVKAYV